MLVKRITYKSYDGEEFTENFYFSLNKPEAMTLQVSVDGGFGNYLNALKDARDGRRIMELVQDLILTSYAIKTPDGKSLMKTEESKIKFKGSAAYDALFTELVLDSKKMAEFFNGILPEDMDEFAEKLSKRAEAESKGFEVIDGTADVK